MSSRMEKHTKDSGVKTRTQRNQDLYGDLNEHVSIDAGSIDVNNAIEFDSHNIGISSRENYNKKRSLEGLVSESVLKKTEQEEPEVVIEENKIYDINEILKLARQDKLFDDKDRKRLINTEYNILTKLDINDIEREDIKKEDLKSLINDIYDQEIPKKIKKYSRKEEEELLNDLITNDSKDTIGDSFSLKEELSDDILDKEVSKESEKSNNKEEISRKIDTTGFDTIFNNTKETESEGKGLIIAIIIVTILILLTLVFFLIDYFFGLKI